jgi:hypothetical protein
MTGLTTQGVEVRRYLVKRGGEWHPALQLLADGEIPPAKLPSLSKTSRARAIATGELGNHLAGEVALFEPPVVDQRRWRVRPYMRTAKLLTDFPFTAPITTDGKYFGRRINSPGDCPAHNRAQILLQPAARALCKNADGKAAFERHGKEKLARMCALSQRTPPIAQAGGRQLPFASRRNGWEEIGCWVVPI